MTAVPIEEQNSACEILEAKKMIDPCSDTDFDTIHAMINARAAAYRDVIPAVCWQDFGR
jgi:hypothetical protein